MAARPSAKFLRWPVATACIMTLPSAAASTGPVTTRRPQASAVNWLSRRFWLPPPTMRTEVRRGPGTPSALVSSSSKRVDDPAIAQRQAFQAAAHDLAHRFGRGLIGAAAEGADGVDHVGRLEEVGRVGVDDALERLRLLGLGQHLRPGNDAALAFELAARFLQQPQAR